MNNTSLIFRTARVLPPARRLHVLVRVRVLHIWAFSIESNSPNVAWSGFCPRGQELIDISARARATGAPRPPPPSHARARRVELADGPQRRGVARRDPSASGRAGSDRSFARVDFDRSFVRASRRSTSRASASRGGGAPACAPPRTGSPPPGRARSGPPPSSCSGSGG